MKKLLLTCAVICAMLVPAGFAQAAKIDNWTNIVQIAYDNMNFTSGTGYSTDQSKTIGGKQVFSIYTWGSTANNKVTATGYNRHITNGVKNDLGYSYITNNPTPITSSKLNYGDVLFGLKLSGGGITTEVTTSLHFGYTESLNRPDGTNPDMFFFTDKWLADTTRNFVVDGHEYQIKLEVEGKYLEELKGKDLALAQSMISSSDYNQKIYGLVIPENISYQLDYYFVLNYIGPKSPPPVPVPGAVWLMGTGIAGLAAIKRRQKKS